MIKNIVFDIGGVLLEYNSNTYLDKLKLDEKIRKEVKNLIFHNYKWRKCLNGIITNQELIDILVKRHGKYKKEIEKILSPDSLKFMMPPKQDSIDYFHKLKDDGHKVYILSNITEDTYNYINSNFDFVKLADGGIYSCFEHISKPNEEIYKKLISKYTIVPAETIFIDDTKGNINKANLLGFNGILFNDLEQIKENVGQIINSHL